MTPTPKNPAAQALGALGGRKRTPAQTAARRANGAKANGRPKKPCACGCGTVTGRMIALLRDQDRDTARALGWAEWSIAPMRRYVYVAPGHDANGVDGYLSRIDEALFRKDDVRENP